MAVSNNTMKLKGIPRSILLSQATFSQFVESLFVPCQYYAIYRQIRRFQHKLYTVEIKKRSVSGLDMKRWSLSPIHTRAFGNCEIQNEDGI